MSISDVSAAETWIKEEAIKLGLQSDVKVIAVVNRWRWTIEYSQNPDYPEFSRGMIKLETALQKKIGRPIDLRLESEADKNKRKQRNVLSESKQPSS